MNVSVRLLAGQFTGIVFSDHSNPSIVCQSILRWEMHQTDWPSCQTPKTNKEDRAPEEGLHGSPTLTGSAHPAVNLMGGRSHAHPSIATLLEKNARNSNAWRLDSTSRIRSICTRPFITSHHFRPALYANISSKCTSDVTRRYRGQPAPGQNWTKWRG